MTTFQALGKAPSSSTPHALRWYNHIKSFSAAESSKFPGVAAAPAAASKPAAADDDDDVDLFGSDDEADDEEAEKIKQERVAAYAAKKSTSKYLLSSLRVPYLNFVHIAHYVEPALIAKSSIVLDVKPWDDETDMAAMEKAVRTITSEGLLWGVCKLPVLLCSMLNQC